MEHLRPVQPYQFHLRKNKKSIIAMKGTPFTGKTQYARLIGAFLGCPVLSLEDVLDVVRPEYLQTCLSSNTNTHTPSSLQPQDLAFQIIYQMTKSHLSNGISDSVVIDSSLSSESHLNQLIELVHSLVNARLLIVECKPQNKYMWEMRFQQFEYKNSEKWYKAKNWHDIEKAIKEDYDETSGLGCKVSKLVLDPLTVSVDKGLTLALLLADRKLLKPPPFVEAVKYMINREDDHTFNIVDYDEWKHFRHYDDGSASGSGQFLGMNERSRCKAGHTITKYTEAGLGYEAKCVACGNQVMAQAYSCDNCSLVLHKDCAESSEPDTPIDHPGFACASCKEDGKSFCENCLSCVNETIFRLRVTPIIIRHECHDDFLCVLPVVPRYMEAYQCAACGVPGRHGMYLCKNCNVAYHYNCLMRPSRVEHEHGGHHHHMQLKFFSEEAEDYICDVCVGNNRDWYLRNPMLWFYSCEECPFETHLDCVSL